ncbi:MAG: glycosyltransferase family 2 protein [Bacteroidia bacterium]|nr:glycosyltransferase family 2 protein [Bacteroidia bacterium]
MKDLSVVIPVFNEELNIGPLYQRLKATMEKLDLSYEFIFVNDGSSDKSLELVKMLAFTDKNVKYIDFSRNFGHQIAVTAGLDKTTGDAVVIIDADMQDPPELIEQLYHEYRNGNDVVYARRRHRQGETALKKFTAGFFYRILSKITTVSIPVDTGDFRIISHKVVKALRNMPEHNKFLRGQISWIGFKQTFVEYDRNERAAGKTGYTYRKMIRFALDGITSFSNFPLKFASIMGFIVSGISFILILFALYKRLINGDTVKGWTSTVIIVLFIGGIQLISLGIMGEYLSRINDSVKNRPLYIVRDSNIEESTS